MCFTEDIDLNNFDLDALFRKQNIRFLKKFIKKDEMRYLMICIFFCT